MTGLCIACPEVYENQMAWSEITSTSSMGLPSATSLVLHKLDGNGATIQAAVVGFLLQCRREFAREFEHYDYGTGAEARMRMCLQSSKAGSYFAVLMLTRAYSASSSVSNCTKA